MERLDRAKQIHSDAQEPFGLTSRTQDKSQMETLSLRGERSPSREPERIAGPPDHRAGGALRLYSFAAQRLSSPLSLPAAAPGLAVSAKPPKSWPSARIPGGFRRPRRGNLTDPGARARIHYMQPPTLPQASGSQAAAPAATVESLDALHVRVAALNRLLEVTQRLAAEVDTQRVLELIASEACLALVCERATVYQFDPSSQELFTRVSTDLEIGEMRHPVDHGISGYVARHRTIVNVPDPPSDPRWNSRIDQLTGYQTRSILAAPLVSPHDGALLGVLQALNNVGGPFDPFDEELILAFASHAAVALDRARMIDELKARQKIEAALNVARQIQAGFMPHEFPTVPGYELASWWLPHQAVGADYCDVLPLDDGRTALVIADVAGHGIGPSLIMASTRAALRALALDHAAPELQLNLLARALLGDLEEGLFITMLIATLDAQRHRVEYSNAGHGPAVHYSAADDRFYPLESNGLPLGVEDCPQFTQGAPLIMEPGDVLVLCTDGIVEATDRDEDPFGSHRLESIVRRLARAPMSELVHEVGRQVEEHYVGATPPDDLTILVARRNE